MADEKDVTLQQLEVVEKGVKDFTAKAESFDKKATEIQKSVEEVKNTVTVFENTVNSLKEWKVSKDEADKKNQEALDKLIGRQKDIQLSGEKLKSFGELLKEGITENVDNLNKFLRISVRLHNLLQCSVPVSSRTRTARFTSGIWFRKAK
jgi:uncharacterized protein (DUF2344 family)